MNLRLLISKYEKIGYNFRDASSKVCQDIILLGISKSKFKKHITIKGGVVLHNISGDMRRATRDLDLDFIKYSLENDSIRNFINIINNCISDINIEIIGKIKTLHHLDYNGKQINIKISDNFNYSIETKVDIGVEKNFDISQDEYVFNLEVIGDTANLLINSKEQIFCEKLKSLLKMGFNSTRYKDLFDFYYLITDAKLDDNKLYLCINDLIFLDDSMRENNMNDILNRLRKTFSNPIYKSSLKDSKVNWLNVDIDDAINLVLEYLSSLELVSV